jgi:MYXO-CTERM domain-containing protein
VDGDPLLAGYDASVTDGRWQDFRLTAASTLAVDKGTALPASLLALLAKLGLDPGQKGAALDLGAIEFDPDNPQAPFDLPVGPRDGGAGDAGAPVAPWPTPVSVDGGGAGPGPGGQGSGGCSCALGGDARHRGRWPLPGFALLVVLALRRRRFG